MVVGGIIATWQFFVKRKLTKMNFAGIIKALFTNTSKNSPISVGGEMNWKYSTFSVGQELSKLTPVDSL